MYLYRLYFGENGKFQLPNRKKLQKPHPDIEKKLVTVLILTRGIQTTDSKTTAGYH